MIKFVFVNKKKKIAISDKEILIPSDIKCEKEKSYPVTLEVVLEMCSILFGLLHVQFLNFKSSLKTSINWIFIISIHESVTCFKF